MFEETGNKLSAEILNSGTHIGNLHSVPKLIDAVGGEHKADINRMFESEMSDTWDFKVWTEIINQQQTFNDKVSPGWLQDVDQQKYDTWSALLDEVAEVMNSKNWKWWKDTKNFNKIDWDNVAVEFVDLFHFMLSIALQKNASDVIFITFVAHEKNKDKPVIAYDIRGEGFFDEVWERILLAVFIKNPSLLVVAWVELWYKLGGDIFSFTKEYFTKMALNNIRQEFGYGINNTYRKMWKDPSDPTGKRLVEDNVAAKYLVEGIAHKEDITENTVKDIEKIYREYYIKYVAV